MKTYDTPPRRPSAEDRPGQPFSRKIDWRAIIASIEEAGALDTWASPEELQNQPKIVSLYGVVRQRSHHVLRELAAEGYEITPRTTNTQMVDGFRSGDLLLKVTKKEA